MVCKGKMEGTISTFPGHRGKLEQLISWQRFHQAFSLELYNSTNRIRKFKSTSTKLCCLFHHEWITKTLQMYDEQFWI